MIKDALRNLIEAAVLAAQADGSLPDFTLPPIDVTRPRQADHGDYSTNVAMVTAAAINKATGEKSNPRAIGQAIVERFERGTLIESLELAGPGFINIRLADGWLKQQVAVIIRMGAAFGDIERGAGQRWQVEFVSANPTGPIHYGGARNAVLGDTLANVLTAAGYEVQREFYVNDARAGTQMQHFAATLYARYAQALGVGEPLPAEGYQGEYMVDYAQRLIAEHGDRFLHLPRAEALDAMATLGLAMVLDGASRELGRIGVRFDNWFSEQSLYDRGLVEEVLEFLDQRGALARHDGAVWFQASHYPKNDKDEVVVRRNGLPTYLATDIAYHYDKFLVRGFDRVVDVWSVDHQGHVPRMAAIMQALGLDPDRLAILMYDLVKLVRDGVEVKLSKRAGNLLTIDDVVAEVGADALRFNLLSRSPESTIEFDLDLAVAQTNENPVYYVQYSHARICSILEKAAAAGLPIAGDVSAKDEAALALLGHPSELALIRKMLELEEQIELAVIKLTPHNLSHYAIDLARIFSAFYRDCRVVDPANAELTRARMLVSRAARTVLAKVLRLMGVSAPESM